MFGPPCVVQLRSWFEAATERDSDVVFDHSAARATGPDGDRSECQKRTGIWGVIVHLAVAQDVTKESMELLGPTFAPGLAASRRRSASLLLCRTGRTRAR